MKKQIEQKLLDNNFIFSELEKTYLIFNDDLRKKVIEAFKKSKKTLSKEFYNFILFYYSRDVEIFYNDDNLKLQFLKCELTYGYDGPTTMAQCLEGLDNKVYIKELRTIYEEIKDKFDITKASEFDNANISSLIANNLLSAINFESVIEIWKNTLI